MGADQNHEQKVEREKQDKQKEILDKKVEQQVKKEQLLENTKQKLARVSAGNSVPNSTTRGRMCPVVGAVRPWPVRRARRSKAARLEFLAAPVRASQLVNLSMQAIRA